MELAPHFFKDKEFEGLAKESVKKMPKQTGKTNDQLTRVYNESV